MIRGALLGAVNAQDVCRKVCAITTEVTNTDFMVKDVC